MIQPFTQVASLSGEAMNSTTNIVVVGFLFVLCVLGTLAVLTTVVGRCFNALAPANEPAPTAVAKPKASTSHSNNAHYPVIAAAVHHALGEKPHHIVSVNEETK